MECPENTSRVYTETELRANGCEIRYAFGKKVLVRYGQSVGGRDGASFKVEGRYAYNPGSFITANVPIAIYESPAGRNTEFVEVTDPRQFNKIVAVLQFSPSRHTRTHGNFPDTTRLKGRLYQERRQEAREERLARIRRIVDDRAKQTLRTPGK